MPGSKRRALKKMFSPTSSPSASPAPPPPPIQISSPMPPPPGIHTTSPNGLTSPTPDSAHHRSPSGHSLFHMPHLGKSSSNSNGNGNGMHKTSSISSSLHPTASMTSASSIVSDPGNYMTDSETKQEAILSEMDEREKGIGSGDHRMGDGVGQLRVNDTPAGGMVNGNGMPMSGEGGGGLPPAPAQAPPVTAQQMTAEELMFGDADGAGKGGKKKSSKQRFDERQARKKESILASAPPSDPHWTAQLERERQEEIQVISDACEALGRDLHEIAPDGHCMYNAIADQLHQVGLIPAHQASNPLYTRRTASQYMLAHPDDFLPFLPSITGEDSAGATEDGELTSKEFKKYCKLVAETGEWGGEPEIQALSRAFSVPIHVIQRGPPTVVSHGGDEDSFGGAMTPAQSAKQGDRVVRITYHRRMYGLGEHYNSLRKGI